MKEKYIPIIDSLSEKKIISFLAQTSTNVRAQKDLEKVTSDTSWIDMIEESIPYLDNIIRNPRRFIVQEENIVPIEKAKVVTEESIRHLAQNTKLIQDVQEDGSVIPLKLLNVYREETTDLYENRFIKSLVDNLYAFVQNKLAESDQKSYAKINNKVTFDGVYKKTHEVTKVTINLESHYEENVDQNKDGYSLETRIENIKDVLAAFLGSQFIKNLRESQPVRSPIRKTNVILKEQNFIKALELWEYLEKNAVKPVTTIEKESIDRSNEVKEYFDLAFYLQNQAIHEDNIEKNKRVSKNILRKTIEELIQENELSETEFKNILIKEFKEVHKEKEKKEKKVRKAYADFINDFAKRKEKALAILK